MPKQPKPAVKTYAGKPVKGPDSLLLTKPFKWNTKRLNLVHALAEGKAKGEACADAGISSERLWVYQHHPDFQAKLKELQDEHEAHIKKLGFQSRERRIETYEKVINGLLMIAIERGASEPPNGEKNPVPGWKGGFVTNKIQSLGDGEYINTYGVDTALTGELKSYLQQMAQEVGQWQARTEHTGKDGGPIQVETILDILIASSAHNQPLLGEGAVDAEYELRDDGDDDDIDDDD